MFNNDVNQTYNFQDASQEILIMVLGAFLLGCLLMWLISKLFSKDYNAENTGSINAYRYDHQGRSLINELNSNNKENKQINSLKQATTNTSQEKSGVEIVDEPSQREAANNITPDDLTKISNIDTKMQTELKQHGIESFVQLRDMKVADLKGFQEKDKAQKREIETWPHQASLAAKGDWEKLSDYQGFIQRIKDTPTTKSPSKKPENSDELTKVAGIDTDIENILNNKEIYTFKQLSHVDSETLKNHIVESNTKYSNNETESWPHQAAMAEKEQWDELKIYQDFMHSESDVASASDINPSNKDNETSAATSAATMTATKQSTLADEINDNDENLSDHDDLKKIEGIDSKVEEVLNKGGIYTFSQLYNSDNNRLKKLLNNEGNKFEKYDTESWPHQAGMANRTEWTQLKSYQSLIKMEQATKASSNVSILDASQAKPNKSKNENESNTAKVTSIEAEDDLRKVEGIGPKIKELLNKAGISSFKQLSTHSRDEIKTLLNEAGPQFRMHEPESWPHQAKLASEGKWEELDKYKKFLVNGRD